MELVRGLGETLVGNAPGGALRFTADKAGLARAAAASAAPCAGDIPGGAIQVRLQGLAMHRLSLTACARWRSSERALQLSAQQDTPVCSSEASGRLSVPESRWGLTVWTGWGVGHGAPRFVTSAGLVLGNAGPCASCARSSSLKSCPCMHGLGVDWFGVSQNPI